MAACKALSECGDKDAPADGRPFTPDPSTVPKTGLHTGATHTHGPRSCSHELGFCPSQLRVEGFFIVVVVDVNWRRAEIIVLKKARGV